LIAGEVVLSKPSQPRPQSSRISRLLLVGWLSPDIIEADAPRAPTH